MKPFLLKASNKAKKANHSWDIELPETPEEFDSLNLGMTCLEAANSFYIGQLKGSLRAKVWPVLPQAKKLKVKDVPEEISQFKLRKPITSERKQIRKKDLTQAQWEAAMKAIDEAGAPSDSG